MLREDFNSRLEPNKNSGFKKKYILPSLLNQQNKAIVSIWARWSAQSPRRSLSFTLHAKACYDGREQNAPKPDAKTPQTSVWKKLGMLPPDQGRAATLDVLGYTM